MSDLITVLEQILSDFEDFKAYGEPADLELFMHRMEGNTFFAKEAIAKAKEVV